MADSPEEEDAFAADAAEYHADQERAQAKLIPLVEMFGPTIQGEGTVIGQQTYFLRFGLCDYKCTMCDSLHAVIPAFVKKNALWLNQQTIFEQLWEFRKPHSTDWITFSGGNPAIHDLTHLVELCHGNGLKVNVETQGTRWLPWLSQVDSLTISPKGPGMGETHDHLVFMRFIDSLHNHLAASEGLRPSLCIKIVVFDQRDLDFAAHIFTVLKEHDLFWNTDTSNSFYLSLGNDLPPPPDGSPTTIQVAPDDYKPVSGDEHRNRMLMHYRLLYEDIQTHPVLSKVRFLPQWHTFVWGNDQGH